MDINLQGTLADHSLAWNKKYCVFLLRTVLEELPICWMDWCDVLTTCVTLSVSDDYFICDAMTFINDTRALTMNTIVFGPVV